MFICSLSFFLYFGFNNKEQKSVINYELGADIINPKFIKEKINKDHLEVLAKKASFLTETKIFLEGSVKYTSDNFILESDKVSFDKNSFNAFSDEKTSFVSKKVSIKSEGFNVEEAGDKIFFKGKSRLIIQ